MKTSVVGNELVMELSSHLRGACHGNLTATCVELVMELSSHLRGACYGT